MHADLINSHRSTRDASGRLVPHRGLAQRMLEQHRRTLELA